MQLRYLASRPGFKDDADYAQKWGIILWAPKRPLNRAKIFRREFILVS